MLTGGYLPKILDAIVDLIPEGASPVAPEPIITTAFPETVNNVTLTEAATALNVSLEDFDAIPKQSVIKVSDVILTRIAYYEGGDGYEAVFGGKDMEDKFGRCLSVKKAGNLYSVIAQEL